MDINGRNKDNIIKNNNSADQDFLLAQPVTPCNTIILYFKQMFLLSLALPAEFLVESSLEFDFRWLQHAPAAPGAEVTLSPLPLTPASPTASCIAWTG